MIKTLKEIVERQFGAAAETDAEPGRGRVELAAAVLMLEISLADSSLAAVERGAIRDLLLTCFNQPADTVEELLRAAEQEVEAAISLHEFTTLLNRRLSAAEKARLIEVLWRVAFADAVLDKYEEYYVRKIADLLHVPHSDYMKAKHKAAATARQAAADTQSD